MPPLPDPSPAPLAWPRAQGRAAMPSAARWPRRVTLGVAGVLAFIVSAAWVVPPLLDWGRVRAGFAAIAAAQLGRPVLLGGQITLRLLPEAVLTASDVSIPDQGDGVWAQLGAMRLQVAVLPLLAGHIVPRDLTLGTPVLHLPWPLPQSLTYPARPLVPRGFAAHMEGGTLRLGQVQITGINAGIHGGPEPGGIGAQRDASGGSAFGAEGFAAFGGRTWRFTSALGGPDADGVSALDLSVTGQGAAGQTGGAIRGTLADGVVQGRVRAGGPDLPLLFPDFTPAAGLPWRIEAPFTADNERIEASAITLSLGASSAEASLALRLASPARLDGQVHAAALDLDGWAHVLGGVQPGGKGVVMPFRLALSADRARLLGGTLAGLQGSIAFDGTSTRLEQAQATLPGQALLQGEGSVTQNASGLQLSGPASLDAPDLHATLAWLHGAAPSLADAAPPATLRRARITGQVSVAQHSLVISDLSGEIDGASVAGGFGVTLGTHPHFAATLRLAQLSLDDWLGRFGPDEPVASLAHRATRLQSDLHIKADRATWYGVPLGGLVLDARTGPAGLAIDRAQATLSGAAVSAKGTLGPDGAMAGGLLAVSTSDASPLLGMLPVSWRVAPELWKGAARLQAALAGPPEGLGVQLRADAGDLVMEADVLADTVRHGMTGTVTLRHPGAPRLLASLGLPGADAWLNTGSLALRAQVSLQPGQVSIPEFDLAAADLRLSGSLALDMSAFPFLHGAIAAETLALPGQDAVRAPFDWLLPWAAQLTITAQQVSLGGRPALAGVVATLGLGGGDGLLDVTQAGAFGGQWTGQLAFAGGRTALLSAEARLAGAHIQSPVAGLPIDLAAGDVDASLDWQASGDDLAAWRRSLSGQLVVSVRDARVSGFDLGQVGRSLNLPARAGKAALPTALSGSTAGLSGMAKLDAAEGRFSLEPAALTSADGAVLLQGWVDGNALDLTFGLMPAGMPTRHLAVRMSGPFGAVRTTADPGGAGVPTRRAKPR